MKRNVSLLAGLLLLVILMTVSTSYAADLNVPTTQYPSIQSAINAAQVGDTVLVAAGTYNENITMKSGINVVGNNPADTIIVGQTGIYAVGFSDVTCAVLKNFTITHGLALTGRKSVQFDGFTNSSAVLQNCILYGNGVTGYYGIIVWDPATPSIVNNTIVGEGTEEQGIYIGNCQTNTFIANNIITGHTMYGIHVFNDPALRCDTSPDTAPSIRYNDVFSNGQNYSGLSDPTGSDGNISANPSFFNPASNDYRLNTGSPCIGTGFPNGEFQNPFIISPGDGGFDMGAFGGGGNTYLNLSKSGTGSGLVSASGGTCLPLYPLTTIPNVPLYCSSGCMSFLPNPDPCASCSSYYTAGSEITLTASADTGSQFVGWSGCGCSGTLSTCTRRYYAGREQVQASFAINTYTVTASAGTGGSINPSTQTVNHGDTTSFTVTPYSVAWYISSVTGCGGSLSGNTYTTGPITGDCTVTATFSPCTYSVSPNTFTFGDSGGTGSFTVTPNNPSCGWYLSFPNWIGSLPPGYDGVGIETLNFTALPNTTSETRTGYIGVIPFASETPITSVEVNEAGCTYAINPYKAVLPASGGTFKVSIFSSNPACEWMAESFGSNADWLHIISPGSGTVTYMADANNSIPNVKRTGTITIAGLTFTVEQQDNSLQETLEVPSSGTWVTATITNNTAETLITAKPTCCNTYFWVTDELGNMVPPRDRICEPVGIPDSLVYILPGGSFEITCDLSEVAQLPQGTINVMATYVNPLTFDPHYDGAGGCLPNDIGRTECFNLKPVVIPSGVTQMDIGAGAAAQKTFAELTFNPQQWDPRWVSENGPEISVQISSASAITCSNVDLSSIRMNGQAGIIPGSCMDTTGGITVKFSGSVAVLSLGSLVPGTVYPTVQGAFVAPDNSIFYGQGAVNIVGGTLTVEAYLHTVGTGSKPVSSKAPISGMPARVFTKACAAQYGISWQNYPAIYENTNSYENCSNPPEQKTDGSGNARYTLPPGDYVVIGKYTSNGTTIYPGGNTATITDGNVKIYRQIIQTAAGQILPAKYQKFTGSELLVIEPEYVEWDGTQELYPFIFESLGDWAVTTSVTPPEGFVADQSSLSVAVNTTLKAVQFTVTDVGSKWVPTKVKHKIKHKGKKTNFYSKVGLKLSARLQKKLGLGEFGEKE